MGREATKSGARCVGYFTSEQDAARAYDWAVVQAHGPTAKRNFPDEVISELPVTVAGEQRQRGQSRYTGVSFVKAKANWTVSMWDSQTKRERHIGSYASEEDAARAYDYAAVQARGPTAKRNFPDEINSEPPVTAGEQRKQRSTSRFIGVSWNKAKSVWRVALLDPQTKRTGSVRSQGGSKRRPSANAASREEGLLEGLKLKVEALLEACEEDEGLEVKVEQGLGAEADAEPKGADAPTLAATDDDDAMACEDVKVAGAVRQMGLSGAHDAVAGGAAAAARAEPGEQTEGVGEKRKAAASAAKVDSAPPKKRGRPAGARNKTPEERQAEAEAKAAKMAAKAAKRSGATAGRVRSLGGGALPPSANAASREMRPEVKEEEGLEVRVEEEEGLEAGAAVDLVGNDDTGAWVAPKVAAARRQLGPSGAHGAVAGGAAVAGGVAVAGGTAEACEQPAAPASNGAADSTPPKRKIGRPAAARAEPGEQTEGGGAKRKAAAPALAADSADGGAPPKKKRGRPPGARTRTPEERQAEAEAKAAVRAPAVDAAADVGGAPSKKVGRPPGAKNKTPEERQAEAEAKAARKGVKAVAARSPAGGMRANPPPSERVEPPSNAGAAAREEAGPEV
ncbi:hypothetical protein FOA52_010210 [Chlamydomonas sp. UWO 241]|nr:hypothetical protein FOA52_010210 [Chlamydomonas sp. UWO 241]